MPFANYFFSVEGAEKKHLIFWSKIVQRKLNELFLWKRKGEHSLWNTVGANEVNVALLKWLKRQLKYWLKWIYK